MNAHAPQARLLIFAKAPVPGRAKTRLIPLLGEAGAAELQAQLLRRTVAMACAAGQAPVELWLAGDGEGALIEELRRDYPIELHRQQGADLGERMAHAASASGSKQLLIIGNDCPSMESGILQQAFASLEQYPLVFQPAEDGGYTLIGMRQAWPELFQAIEWGSAQVLEQSLQRARELGLAVKLLSMGWDLDRPEDYRRAVAASLVAPINPEGQGGS